jgi:methylglutaconyl-CoA hydratase
MSENILLDSDDRGVATITLNRPDKRNAFGDELIADLTLLLRDLETDPAVRVVVLTGAGETFSAGADLNWMRAMAGYTREENIEDALKLADLMEALDTLAKPTVARVTGHAFGGAVGLIACCDIALASKKARLALSEVRLGLVPAVISPYVIAAVGPRQARRLFLSAEAITAKRARKMGLVHEVADPEDLDVLVEEQLGMLLAGGPQALEHAKRLMRNIAGRDVETRAMQRQYTAELIADLRAGEEGQDGLGAFLEKRKPGWVKT